MEGLTNVLSSIPWYGWIAIVAIVCGAAVKVFASKSPQQPQ
jgi:hypothetical protein